MKNLPDFEKAELARLHEEIQKDRDLQFRVFWQALTVTATIFLFFAAIIRSTIVINFPFVFLIPHFVLLPSTAIILNRARTGNRKNGYIMVKFDKFSEAANWEKDLALFRSKYGEDVASQKEENNELIKTQTHRASTLKSMIVTITLLEIFALFIFGAFAYTYANNHQDFYAQILPYICFIYTSAYFSLVAKRLRAFFCTRYDTSIQGYATKWAHVADINIENIKNFPKWDVNIWREIRNNELSFWNKKRKDNSNQKKNLCHFFKELRNCKVNWSCFVWFFLFKTYRKKTAMGPVPSSWIRPIIFSAWFFAIVLAFFSLFSIDTMISSILSH